jgi:type IV pilus assembly protein PilB
MKTSNSDSVSVRRVKNQPLGELLIESKIITREQLDEALAVQQANDNGGRKFSGEILVELGFTDEENIFQAFTRQYQFPYLPLNKYQISPETRSIIPDEIAHKHKLVPVDRLGSILTVAMSNPLDNQAIKEVEAICNCDVRIFITSPSDIRTHIEKYYNGKGTVV